MQVVHNPVFMVARAVSYVFKYFVPGVAMVRIQKLF